MDKSVEPFSERVSLVQDFVTRFSAGSFYWVGLTDEKSGRWEWVNQTPYVMNRRYDNGVQHHLDLRSVAPQWDAALQGAPTRCGTFFFLTAVCLNETINNRGRAEEEPLLHFLLPHRSL